MENHSKYIFKVCDIPVYTNLEVVLKTRTTNEEACKEVTRMIEGDDLFEGYEWKIEGCTEGGIRNFNEQLQTDIVERLEQEEPEDSVFWNGTKIQFELNVAHIPVNTDLVAPLKSESKEEAVGEIEALRNSGNLFEGYEWKIDGCTEGGINDFSADLQTEIIKYINQHNIGDSIE
jgi:hypothetical protein